MRDHSFPNSILRNCQKSKGSISLGHGSRIAVIGGGPAGSLFSYFLLSMSKRIGLKINVDIYEPRDFNIPGPQGCNMCGGVLYESLVQSLALEGINLPTGVVQRGIEFNMLHFDEGDAVIQTPLHEKRIASTFRGIGPRGLVEIKGGSLDSYLLQAALNQGAQHIRKRVKDVSWSSSPDSANLAARRIQVKTQGGQELTYDLLAVASGVNTTLLKQFRNMDFGYEPPQTTKLVVREYYLGEEVVSSHFGPVFHAFLLDIPGLDYGAIIPKGDYITICLLSSHEELHGDAIESFLKNPVVKRALPPNFSPEDPACQCGPRINVNGSKHPFGNRVVFIGDCGVSRLYKDGIGAAYRSAKVAAAVSIFQGISADDFRKYYLKFCRKMEADNQIGKFIFRIAGLVPKTSFSQKVILRMISAEYHTTMISNKRMSMVVWDMLTGGAPYLDVLLRAIHPLFLVRVLWYLLLSLLKRGDEISNLEIEKTLMPNEIERQILLEELTMNLQSALGKVYQNGEIIIQQGEAGNSMYVVQDGKVEVLKEINGQVVQLAILGKDDFFGEMEFFENEGRLATVRAFGQARVLTIDHHNLLHRIHEDPSLAYRLVLVLSRRIRKLHEDYAPQLVSHLEEINPQESPGKNSP
jgi:flavin-dependent dehydrogenase